MRSVVMLLMLDIQVVQQRNAKGSVTLWNSLSQDILVKT